VKPRVVAGIFARGGSKGVPRKNLRLIHGKPLIAYAIEAARASSLIERVIVSTDDAEIADVSLEWGAEVPFMRPAELARDDSPEWLAWQHAIQMLDGQSGSSPWDALVSVPTTSPLRKVEDIDACIAKLLGGDADIVITVRKAERSPYFNMVTLDAQGGARLVIAPDRPTFRRQDAPDVFDVTTVAYAARPAFVLSSTGLFQGRVEAVVVPAERAIDIDTEFDFRMAECLLQQSGTRS
jgi:CMP-N-acetylneuraminic acid synthetase